MLSDKDSHGKVPGSCVEGSLYTPGTHMYAHNPDSLLVMPTPFSLFLSLSHGRKKSIYLLEVSGYFPNPQKIPLHAKIHETPSKIHLGAYVYVCACMCVLNTCDGAVVTIFLVPSSQIILVLVE